MAFNGVTVAKLLNARLPNVANRVHEPLSLPGSPAGGGGAQYSYPPYLK